MKFEDSRAEIHHVVVGPMDNNVYVLRCKETGQAVLIDAANEHDRLLELCRRLNVVKVLETHGHWDHIQAVPAVRDAGIDVGVTPDDSGMLPSYDVAAHTVTFHTDPRSALSAIGHRYPVLRSESDIRVLVSPGRVLSLAPALRGSPPPFGEGSARPSTRHRVRAGRPLASGFIHQPRVASSRPSARSISPASASGPPSTIAQ